ncbi:MAG: 4-(cytidine 5'-diphospho)-2-C-methyl-D-erythritol kinase [Elusimicrobia bacterium]|nr:4-(cytidine 5'-diphospho)-2-C-methyl-D-erythritol kinase [Elusimicrobiota bacterium]
MLVQAPAKVNLFLEIINKREDGYHNIESIMHTVSLFDNLEFTEIKENKVELVCSDKNLPVDGRNLVYRAAEKFKKEYNINTGIKINLTKNIPMGAGLGGGSSDAAAVLVALNKIWKINDKLHNLEKLAAKLGADVPFFLTGGTAKISGIGDIVEKLKTDCKYNFVLVKPNFGVSTVYAYSKVKFPLTNVHKIDNIMKDIEQNSLSFNNAKDLFFNRFEEFVFEEYSEIKQIKNTLESIGCISLMSGSGATVFGLLQGQEKMNYVAEELAKYNWNVWFADSFKSCN